MRLRTEMLVRQELILQNLEGKVESVITARVANAKPFYIRPTTRRISFTLDHLFHREPAETARAMRFCAEDYLPFAASVRAPRGVVFRSAESNVTAAHRLLSRRPAGKRFEGSATPRAPVVTFLLATDRA